MLTLSNTTIPTRLLRLPQPPSELFVEGELESLLQKPCVGIVGSRKLTIYGKQITYRLASELAGRGVVIVSGLALGVDSVAHQAALDAGGKTIAVLPSSLDNVYPSSHRPLARAIVQQGGALVSEYPGGSYIMNHQFIARNRIIAALSDKLLVTEAALKSGSLHTARFALEQGIDVFAVPGNITSSTSEGTNNLLKAGAIFTTSSDDILLSLGLGDKPQQRSLPLALNGDEQIVLNLLAEGITDGTELQVRSELSIEVFSQTLTMLEITGKIRALGANHWSL